MGSIKERVLLNEGVGPEQAVEIEERLCAEKGEQQALEVRISEERQFLEETGALTEAQELANGLRLSGYKDVELLMPRDKASPFRLIVCWSPIRWMQEPHDERYYSYITLTPSIGDQQIILRGRSARIVPRERCSYANAPPGGFTRLQKAILDSYRHPDIASKVDIYREFVSA